MQDRFRSLILIVAGMSYCASYFLFFSLPEKKALTVLIQPIQIQEKATPFFRQKILQAQILRAGDRVFTGIHPHVSIPLKKRKISPNHCYQITQITLTRKKDGEYFASVTKNSQWNCKEKKISFASLRIKIHHWIQQKIQHHYRQPIVRHLFISLFTGKRVSFFLNALLNEVGLTHLLAISGLHFSILMGFFFFLIKRIPSFLVQGIAMGLLSSFLFLYFGPAPSVTRAYTFCLLYAFSFMIHRKPTALNTLGMALLLQVVLCPLSIHSLSLQMSFLATFAIVFFTPVMESFFLDVFQDPPLDLEKIRFFPKLGYVIRVFLRKTLSINFSVHLFLVPLLLYRFHFFPLSSFYLNLWIPLGIAIGMHLFVLGLFFPLLHTLNAAFIEKIFYFLEYRNLFFRVNFTFSPSLELLFFLYCSLFFLGMRHYERSKLWIPFRL